MAVQTLRAIAIDALNFGALATGPAPGRPPAIIVTEPIQGRYYGGSLKLPESRLIANLLLRQVNAEGWRDAIVTKNVLRARNPATARRLTRLIRGRLETMGPNLWKLVRDGNGGVADRRRSWRWRWDLR
jgi:hypothetical protein